MATILFQAAGAALGGVFGPIGAIAGRAVGALAGSAVDRALIGGSSTVTGARLQDGRIPGADEGAGIVRVYGTARVGGTLIWATRFEEEVTSERAGGKATGPRVETYSYFGNFAVGICEGPIAGIRQVWADGRELDLTELPMRLYRGDEDQLPDPLIEARQGAGNAPAYRGLAYAVFERLPLDSFGNRIPILQFEVLRPTGTLENRIRAVTIIPGSSEHGYDPRLVTERLGAGEGRNINRNNRIAATDWTASIDELQALCPNLERVALVVAWFGTDLRAGHCRIVPGVEVAARSEESRPWAVSGIGRGQAHVVSESGGGPAYGGTPSDESVVAAIADLRRRGLKVYLYPFMLMDVAAGNDLPDPYGATGQAAYPWRGRITCHPATGQPASADRTAAARAQVEAFCGEAATDDFTVSGTTVVSGAGDEGYRRMVLHYALLAEAAGGVDGFIIGSELRGLTQVRDETGAFPFVEVLCDLAADVRAIVGPQTKLTYGADWSEYFGYHPADGSGEVHFNLDPLWASAAIDAIGIDNYMPLSDWRDGDAVAGNPDGFRLADDAAAMRGQIAAGEGYDWYYASPADRQARLRSPITDGMAGRDWLYRYKDLEGWWTNPHRERAGGAELPEPTSWQPRSKPIWFTELGCPAVDKGANQPNVFTDPKSAENALPYFSAGGRADAMQRRFLDAHLGWWRGEGPEPGMVDPDHIFLWTWDARPYPAFPENDALWADGHNWQLGHWLNGRLGATTVADAIAAILSDHGFSDFDVSRVGGDLVGLVQAEPGSARSLLEPLMAAFQIDAVEEGATLVFRSRLRAALPAIEIDVLAERPDETAFEEVRGHGSEFAGEAVLDHLSDTAAYQRVTARSRRTTAENDRVLRLSLPAVLHGAAAVGAAEAMLRDHRAGMRRLTFRLPPNALSVMPGDVVRLADGPDGRFVVTRVTEGEVREIEAQSFAGGDINAPVPFARQSARSAAGLEAAAFLPDVQLLDLPAFEAGPEESFARVAVLASPWRPVLVSSSPGADGYAPRVRLERPARIGRLAADLSAGAWGRFDRVQAIELDLTFGALSTKTRNAVLGGDNRIAVAAPSGRWEILGFLEAEETAPRRWRLGGLLRGLAGSEDAMAEGHPAGSVAVLLDAAVRPLSLTADEAGRSFNFIVEARGAVQGGAPVAFAGGMRARTPLAPVHLRARRRGDGAVLFSWTRRARRDADGWEGYDIPLDEPSEAYRLEILAGGAVVRSVETDGPFHTYAAADETLDFGAAQPAITIRVRQLGLSVRDGMPAERTVTT
ncbi:baseplate multidomain protein megatron [Rhizobium sp. GN54]|uniref:baseplate multidomain protein megatron n=1 Tax=Rhizobium sp. GN54 TaxID=2898150 RepID=UPI001E4767EC|nr:glycoside hydrolase/phage tail family protein [Rhizobium sp. GN54]MCD2181003.1 glycoside hydrolase/phage tail family protein [Rhizobium sp. GN54]